MSNERRKPVSDKRPLIHPNEAIIVTSSLNANPRDRRLARSEVRPVQVIFDDGTRAVPFFNSWGELGVSSMAWRPEHPDVMYVVTEYGANNAAGLFRMNMLYKVDLSGCRMTDLRMSHLRDVHEITVIDDTLWLANTGLDEVVAFDLSRERISQRISLSVHGSEPKVIVHDPDYIEGEPENVDMFHCNQAFEGFEGDLYGLVHFAVGKQLARRVSQKLIKREGNGGVINLTSGQAIPLGLRQPHTVRKIDGNYWIMDSGNSSINVYSPDWVYQETFPSRGWCRGGDISQELGLFYVGVSEIRTRYLNVVPSSQHAPNMVQAISVETQTPVEEMPLDDIEQVNNVYVVPREIATAILRLGA